MGLKFYLIGITAVAVVADSMLLPFYPQYFAERFGIDSPEHVGSYTAAICLVAMLALPLWAKLARRQGTLQLLIWTQLGAMTFCVATVWAQQLWLFWLLSLVMIVFKASYLLVYPFLMERVTEAEHAHTIGVLSIVVHFGHIAGALLGGMALVYWPLKYAFLLMAIGDLLQILVCAYLLWAGLDKGAAATVSHHEAQSEQPEPISRVSTGSRRIYGLGVLMLLFYFSEYQVVPFFVEYWQQLETGDNLQLASFIYAIPAFVALVALVTNRLYGEWGSHVYFCLPLAIGGLLLQASGEPSWVIMGRLMFGWASFQLTVKLDALLFASSAPEAYAADYAKINIFQNVGVLLSYYGAGVFVAIKGLAFPFIVAAGGLLLTLICYPLFVDNQQRRAIDATS
ncbi:MFS transporter [Shewanella sp. 3B26]|uniref:MFS transporter n=1 Tax=Shewanella zhuhaiensis TaxID=2919576 RepID=A0AAJ1BKH9_9GAMM|nr:MFS transporter [Shewanella zhuhaiensis]MCH4295454.1 MFS transporter [Shewanella zhuhaiensis]